MKNNLIDSLLEVHKWFKFRFIQINRPLWDLPYLAGIKTRDNCFLWKPFHDHFKKFKFRWRIIFKIVFFFLQTVYFKSVGYVCIGLIGNHYRSLRSWEIMQLKLLVTVIWMTLYFISNTFIVALFILNIGQT